MNLFPPSHADVLACRGDLRRRALAAREALVPAAREALTQRVIGHLEILLATLSPRVLGFCWPYRGEPDLRAWIGRWLVAAPGRTAALPAAFEADRPLSFHSWVPGAEMGADRHGIPIPADGEDVVPDALLVPLNAFDARGFRLGYGGGYFDRTLETLAATAIGVGFELGRVATVFPQDHDQPMDWIVTEAGACAAVRD